MSADAGIIRPQQTRSTEKLQRILEATELLLRQRTYDELSISDIVKQAGVSIGTFYNRFRSKESLMSMLLDDYWTRTSAALDTCISSMNEHEVIEDRLKCMIDYFVEDYSMNAGILRSIVLRWRLDFSTVTGKEEHAATIITVGRLAESIQAKDDIDLEDATYCVHVVANLCRDFCLFPELLAEPTLADWESSIRAQLLRACQGLITYK